MVKIWPSRQEAPKTKRTSGPKVKSGCRTCKASHVKCDEQKPSCSRCHRLGTACEYAPACSRRHKSATHTSSSSSSYRPLLPRAAVAHNHAEQQIRLMKPSVLSAFLRPWEVQYYDTFRLRLVPQLHYGHSEFWRRTVMREVASDECVRNAVLALGALGRAHDQCDEDTFFVPWHKKRLEVVNTARGSGMSVPNHYYQALVHHSRALSAFRGLLAGTQDRNTPRSILIASLLLIQFEFLQGNTEAADQIGAYCLVVLFHKIMRGSLGCRYTTSTGTINDNTLRNVDETSDGLQPPRSLIATSIDDESLAQAEIDLLLKTTFNAAYSALHPRSRKVILDLDLPFLRGPSPPPAAASAAVFSATWTRCLATVALWYYRMQNRMLRAQERHHNHLDADTVQFQDHRYETGELLDVLGKWQAAVSQRLSYPTTTPDEREMYSKAAIAIQGAYYSICTVLDPSSGAWTAYEAATTELLDQCEAIIVADAAGDNNSNSKLSEGMSSMTLRDQGEMHESALPVVSQIAQQNRDPALRRRAMALWSRCVSKERSHWDVLATYLSSRAVMDVEEEEEEEEEAERDSVAVDGEMSLEKQWFWSGGVWSEDYTEFKAVVSRKVPRLDGSVERRVVIMPVGGRGPAPVLS